MSNSKMNSGKKAEILKIESSIKAGRLATNHSEDLKLRWIILPPDGNPKNHNETLKVASQVKAGIARPQHNETLKVASSLKAGLRVANHNKTLAIRSQVKAGAVHPQHNETFKVASQLNAGMIASNHNESLHG